MTKELIYLQQETLLNTHCSKLNIFTYNTQLIVHEKPIHVIFCRYKGSCATMLAAAEFAEAHKQLWLDALPCMISDRYGIQNQNL